VLKEKDIITIVGGGSSTHTLIPLLSGVNRKINILTSKPELWHSNINLEWQNISGKVLKTFQGQLHISTSDPKKVIPLSDIIILCMPVYQYRSALENISKFINEDREVYIGTIYGQGGFNWMINEIKQTHKLNKLITFSIGLIPWICRIKEYGKTGIMYGVKSLNIVAIDRQENFLDLNNRLLNDICFKWFGKGKFRLADNFISLTLSVDNQIIHTSRLYGLYKRYGGKWNILNNVPYFYRDYDEISANLLKALDDDYSLIREAIKKQYIDYSFPYMLNYLALERLSYNSENKNIKESFINSQTLGAIKTPVIKIGNMWEFDKNHRFFYDDIYYGLCIAKWIAQKMEIQVKTIDEILIWAEKILNDKILDKGCLLSNSLSGSPDNYGYTNIDQIIK